MLGLVVEVFTVWRAEPQMVGRVRQSPGSRGAQICCRQRLSAHYCGGFSLSTCDRVYFSLRRGPGGAPPGPSEEARGLLERAAGERKTTEEGLIKGNVCKPEGSYVNGSVIKAL